MYTRAVAWERSHNPQPLILPISLEPGTIKTREIKIDLSRDYDIAIDFEGSRLRAERMNVDIKWQLWEGARIVAQGSSVDKPWQNWGGTVERTLGTFTGQAGLHYSLILQVNPETSQLNYANPTLMVQIPRGLWEGYVTGLFVQKLPSYVLGLIGLLIGGGSILFRSRVRDGTTRD